MLAHYRPCSLYPLSNQEAALDGHHHDHQLFPYRGFQRVTTSHRTISTDWPLELLVFDYNTRAQPGDDGISGYESAFFHHATRTTTNVWVMMTRFLMQSITALQKQLTIMEAVSHSSPRITPHSTLYYLTSPRSFATSFFFYTGFVLYVRYGVRRPSIILVSSDLAPWTDDSV